MNSSKSRTLFKPNFHEEPSKIYFDANRSFMFDKVSSESLSRLTNQNFVSSYPIFESKKSKIINPPSLQENQQQTPLQKKKSLFLKNYNQKLKRQRKRQNKLRSSLKDIKKTQNSSYTNRTLDPRNQISSIYASPKAFSNYAQHQQNSQILVLRKSQFLDTLSSAFKQKSDYSKDVSLQMLLKQIYEIKNQEKKQIQKIKQKKFSIERQIFDKKKRNQKAEGYFTKYERGFTLPMKRKLTHIESTPSKDYGNNQKSSTDQTFTQKYSNRKNAYEKSKLEKFYNFKQIDPWDNPNNREQIHSLDSIY